MLPPLWIALYFPSLPIEICGIASPGVVVEQHRVVAVNRAAAQLGITAQMRLGSAHALAPELWVGERNRIAEDKTLQSLACWAGKLTPSVSLASHNVLLLEVGGCLNFFGGIETIIELAKADIQTHGLSVQLGIAPTPLAATWRAYAGCAEPWLDAENMRDAIANLSYAVLNLPLEQQKMLASWGVRTLADVFALPTAGLNQRLGTTFTIMLARALGEIVDPRSMFVFPEQFSQQIEWGFALDNAMALAFPARRLINALNGWLTQRASGVRSCDLLIHHSHQTSTQLHLGFSRAAWRVEHIERVLREQLQNLKLPCAALGMELRATRIEALSGENLSLLGNRAANISVSDVVDRIRARLGGAAAQYLHVQADYRPEHASTLALEPALSLAPVTQKRPAFLLTKPLALREVKGRPYYHGPLLLFSNPERIESGWWDHDEVEEGGDIQRDYFIARTQNGQWLWIFKDWQGWWKHGVFA